MFDSALLQHSCGYIQGRWTGADSGRTLPVSNPATGETLAEIADMGTAQTIAAIDAAAAEFHHEPPVGQRKIWLEAIAERLIQNKTELARIITSEQGKPLKESAVEVEYAATFFRFVAQNLEHLQARQLAPGIRNLRWAVHHRPAGVAALITPWNFPLAMIAKKLASAIGSGCCAVVKPADLTPLTCIALWHIIDELDLPPGRLNLVLGKPGPIGNVMCSHPAVRLISFTGSTAVGKHLIQNTAAHVKRLALELGGNAPFIVMDDADVVAAADALMANKFRCAGQTCVCANRVYAQKRVFSMFTETLASRVARLRVGNGMDSEIDIGPLINRAGFDKVHRHVSDAMSQGAKRIVGSDRPRPANDWGAFYSPTILVDITEQMLVAREETFGPVVAIESFENEERAIELANGTEYGLAAYLFTGDVTRAQRLAGRLQFGHVGLNTGAGPAAEAPFGGMKQSGFGREGGIEGLLEFCEPQVVVMP